MGSRKLPAAKTTLNFGLVNVPVALLKMTAKPADQKYETAGPNGHPLHTETRLFKPGTDEMIEKREAVEEEPEDLIDAAREGAPRAGEFDPEPKMDPTAAEPMDPEQAQKAFAEAAGLNTPEQRQVLVEDESGVVVPKDEIRRGLRQDDGSFLDLTDGLAEIDEAVKLDRMGVVAFMDIGQVPRELVRDSSYLMADSPEARRALGILYHGMRETRRAAVVKWTKREGQALGVLVTHGRSGALVLLEMAWPNHVRDVESDGRILGHTGYETPRAALEACVELIGAMSVTREGSFEQQRNDRERLRAELIERAKVGEEFHVPAEPVPVAPGSVEELMVESGARKDELAKAA